MTRPISERKPGETVPLRVIAAENKAAGFYWFSPGAMRGFGTILPARATIGPDGRAWFVTSELPPHSPRVYKVRAYDPTARQVDSVETHDPDQLGHATRTDAERAMLAAMSAAARP